MDDGKTIEEPFGKELGKLLAQLAKTPLPATDSQLLFAIMAIAENQPGRSLTGELSCEELLEATAKRSIQAILQRLSARNILFVNDGQCSLNLNFDTWKEAPGPKRTRAPKKRPSQSKALSRSNTYQDTNEVSPLPCAIFDSKVLFKQPLKEKKERIGKLEGGKVNSLVFTLSFPCYQFNKEALCECSMNFNGVPIGSYSNNNPHSSPRELVEETRGPNVASVSPQKAQVKARMSLWRRILKTLKKWFAV